MIELTGSEQIQKVGFASPITEKIKQTKTFSQYRRARVELLATVALAVSLVVAVTTVSIGMARAPALHALSASDHAALAVAMLFGLVMAGMGGLTAFAARGPGSDVAESGPNFAQRDCRRAARVATPRGAIRS